MLGTHFSRIVEQVAKGRRSMAEFRYDATQGRRGNSSLAVCDQIILAAQTHFRKYGYKRTTISGIATDIGYSKAYIYKFFESKRSLGEVICTRLFAQMIEHVNVRIAEEVSQTARMRTLVRELATQSMALWLNERNLHDIASTSFIERWACSQAYVDQIMEILALIVIEGRRGREFERKTPMDEILRALLRAMFPLCNPAMSQYIQRDFPEGANDIANLVLRSLVP
ncbi:MAG TPA: TetR/AcrR family transcriptional regulator [Sphingobium sp.]|uniref:TetR/AcrR family transcriptional regulator n=1 Tax=Sphingobium sp. TaxID=1912891 RepID=UPI002ED03602